MINLNPVTEKQKKWKVVNAVLYSGDFKIPYFFEGPHKKMMKEKEEGGQVNFKTFDGEIFQFYLDIYHRKTVLAVTSTLEDYFIMPPKDLGLEKGKAWAERNFSKKHQVKGAYSGYYTWGKWILDNYATLSKHLEERGVIFTDSDIEQIFAMLRKEKKHERSSGTRYCK